ncbi:hypothetical protein [Psittacicella gerlachiana]|uniref:Uncharacterized protein n=1 Tax=Psittacicella gerlachiana TaxID=2028574 RepID=A0A3A1YCH7_9GAMM|nr:hypothetical protein [Psittacicella gerlachiana]RIY35076.1 hypothetical protein CKF59_04175 [Psittacicella gerlachiana]
MDNNEQLVLTLQQLNQKLEHRLQELTVKSQEKITNLNSIYEKQNSEILELKKVVENLHSELNKATEQEAKALEFYKDAKIKLEKSTTKLKQTRNQNNDFESVSQSLNSEIKEIGLKIDKISSNSNSIQALNLIEKLIRELSLHSSNEVSDNNVNLEVDLQDIELRLKQKEEEVAKLEELITLKEGQLKETKGTLNHKVDYDSKYKELRNLLAEFNLIPQDTSIKLSDFKEKVEEMKEMNSFKLRLFFLMLISLVLLLVFIN